MNIYDVSRSAKVSIATVSRVLNGNPNVSDKTRKRVLDVMDELGYTPNVFARGLGLNTMQTVGIMCSDSSDIYMANALNYIERELRLNGYDSILCSTGSDNSTRKKYIDLLLSKRVDAIILIGSKYIEVDGDNSCLLDAAARIPVMLLNGYIDAENIYCSHYDDHAAIYNAFRLLYNKGKRKILYLYSSTSQSGNKKRKGYLKACTELTGEEGRVIHCPKDINAAKEALFNAAKEGIEFDAVITSSDALAVGAVKYAHSQGIKIPEELAVIGYDSSILSISTDPEITSINSKSEELCINIVQKLMKVFAGETVERETVIQPDITIRATT